MPRLRELSIWFNAIAAIVAGLGFLWLGDRRLERVAFEKAVASGYWPMLADVMLGLFVILPLSAVGTWAAFRATREQVSLPNVATVFAAIFAVLSCFYFLWAMGR